MAHIGTNSRPSTPPTNLEMTQWQEASGTQGQAGGSSSAGPNVTGSGSSVAPRPMPRHPASTASSALQGTSQQGSEVAAPNVSESHRPVVGRYWFNVVGKAKDHYFPPRPPGVRERLAAWDARWAELEQQKIPDEGLARAYIAARENAIAQGGGEENFRPVLPLYLQMHKLDEADLKKTFNTGGYYYAARQVAHTIIYALPAIALPFIHAPDPQAAPDEHAAQLAEYREKAIEYFLAVFAASLIGPGAQAVTTLYAVPAQDLQFKNGSADIQDLLNVPMISEIKVAQEEVLRECHAFLTDFRAAQALGRNNLSAAQMEDLRNRADRLLDHAIANVQDQYVKRSGLNNVYLGGFEEQGIIAGLKFVLNTVAGWLSFASRSVLASPIAQWAISASYLPAHFWRSGPDQVTLQMKMFYLRMASQDASKIDLGPETGPDRDEDRIRAGLEVLSKENRWAHNVRQGQILQSLGTDLKRRAQEIGSVLGVTAEEWSQLQALKMLFSQAAAEDGEVRVDARLKKQYDALKAHVALKESQLGPKARATYEALDHAWYSANDAATKNAYAEKIGKFLGIRGKDWTRLHALETLFERIETADGEPFETPEALQREYDSLNDSIQKKINDLTGSKQKKFNELHAAWSETAQDIEHIVNGRFSQVSDRNADFVDMAMEVTPERDYDPTGSVSNALRYLNEPFSNENRLALRNGTDRVVRPEEYLPTLALSYMAAFQGIVLGDNMPFLAGATTLVADAFTEATRTQSMEKKLEVLAIFIAVFAAGVWAANSLFDNKTRGPRFTLKEKLNVAAGARGSGPIGGVYLPRLLYDRGIERWREAAGEHDKVGWRAFFTVGYHVTGFKLSVKRFVTLFQQAIPSRGAAKAYLELQDIRAQLVQARQWLNEDRAQDTEHAHGGEPSGKEQAQQRALAETAAADIEERIEEIDAILASAPPQLKDRAEAMRKASGPEAGESSGTHTAEGKTGGPQNTDGSPGLPL